MGARANIVIMDGSSKTNLYTQHGGRAVAQALARALGSGTRTASTIFERMHEEMPGDIRIDDPAIPDFDELHVDLAARTVSQVTFDIVATKTELRMDPRVVERWSLEEFAIVGEDLDLPEPMFIIALVNAGATLGPA